MQADVFVYKGIVLDVAGSNVPVAAVDDNVSLSREFIYSAFRYIGRKGDLFGDTMHRQVSQDRNKMQGLFRIVVYGSDLQLRLGEFAGVEKIIAVQVALQLFLIWR